MVFKPDLGVNGVRWGQSVYALGVMLLEMFVKSKLNQSQIVPSQVSQTTRPIEEKEEGDSYFKPRAENAFKQMKIKSELGEWM